MAIPAIRHFISIGRDGRQAKRHPGFGEFAAAALRGLIRYLFKFDETNFGAQSPLSGQATPLRAANQTSGE
jgi:hypothetical protein